MDESQSLDQVFGSFAKNKDFNFNMDIAANLDDLNSVFRADLHQVTSFEKNINMSQKPLQLLSND